MLSWSLCLAANVDTYFLADTFAAVFVNGNLGHIGISAVADLSHSFVGIDIIRDVFVIATGLRLFEDNLADVIVCVNKTSADRGSEQLALIVTVVCQVTENTADFRELPFEYIEINLLTEFVGVDDFLAVAYKNLI